MTGHTRSPSDSSEESSSSNHSKECYPYLLLGYRALDGLDYTDYGNLRLQRLYSSFARGWPGAGLLCLRLIAAIATFHHVTSGLVSDPSLLRILIEGAAGLLLCAGLWTPIAGSALSVVALWSAFSENGDFWTQLLSATVAVALAMLGPGAWSIDARLFGRKRIIRER
jgi:putative oxidoreductase